MEDKCKAELEIMHVQSLVKVGVANALLDYDRQLEELERDTLELEKLARGEVVKRRRK